MKSKPFGNVKSEDFFKAVSLPSQLAVSTQAFLEPWLLQKNYPKLFVALLENDSGNTRVRFLQDRFLLSEFDEDNEKNFRWKMYIKCIADGETNGSYVNHLEGSTNEFVYFLESTNG